MLKVYVYAGDLASSNPGKHLVVMDIAYAKKNYLSDYAVAMSIRGTGEVQPDIVKSYPRWSSSLWDLVARALTRILYRADQAPELATADKRCAYATKICARIERATLTGRSVELATAEIAQIPKKRGTYHVKFWEEIQGTFEAELVYGLKSLNPADLLLRSICKALFGKDTLGPKPILMLPPTINVDGVDRFHMESLREPAKTGFLRYRANGTTGDTAVDPMPRVDDYARFLKES